MERKRRFGFGLELAGGSLRHRGVRWFNLAGSTLSAYLSTARAPFLPPLLFVEVTTRCNLRCFMCPHTFQNYENLDMDFDDFKGIMTQFPALSRLIPQGIGESLLWAPIFDAIGFARERGVSVELNTNGTLLNETRARSLIESGIDVLTVSIDGATEDTYQSIRGGDTLRPVLHNLERMVALKRELGSSHPQLGVRTVALKRNMDEIPDIIKIALDVGVRRVTVQDMLDYGGRLADYLIDRDDFETLKQYRDEAATMGVDLILENFSRFERDRRRCISPWVSPYITREGYVTPCCIITDPSTINFGNVFETPFRDIWNGESFVEFRRAFREGRAPAFCQSCPRY